MIAVEGMSRGRWRWQTHGVWAVPDVIDIRVGP